MKDVLERWGRRLPRRHPPFTKPAFANAVVVRFRSCCGPGARGQSRRTTNPTVVLLSRIQFGFVMSFHIIFPAFTIGLASWLAFLAGAYLKTRRALWRDLYVFWLKIFAVSFGWAWYRASS